MAQLTVLLLFLSSAFLSNIIENVEATSDKIVCYYASWNHYKTGVAKYTVDDIPYDKCTHLIYAFVVLDPFTFLMKSHDKWLDVDLNNLEKVTKLKEKNPNLKVLLAVGGWTDSRDGNKYSTLVKDPRKMESFAKHAVEVLKRYNFDGLDLDWEYPAYESDPSDKQGFTEWIKILKSYFDPNGLLLTAAVSAGKNNIDKAYDVPAIAPLFDFINVMTYDFHGSWENIARHHSPLYPQEGADPSLSTSSAIDYWIRKGAPRNKLIIGVPFYGRSWTLAHRDGVTRPGAKAIGRGDAGEHTKNPGTLAFYELCHAHQKEGWIKWLGNEVMGPYLTKDKQWVGYDDVESIKMKAKYVKENQLGGVMIWDISTDDFNNICGYGKNPLLSAIYDSLYSRKPSPPKRIKLPDEFGKKKIENNLLSINNDFFTNDIRSIETKDFRSPKNFNIGSGSSSFGELPSNNIDFTPRTTKRPFEWQNWPVFSEKTTENPLIPNNQQINNNDFTNSHFLPTKQPIIGRSTKFPWQSWAVFQNNPTQNQGDISFVTTIRPSTNFVKANPTTFSDFGETYFETDTPTSPVQTTFQNNNQRHSTPLFGFVGTRNRFSSSSTPTIRNPTTPIPTFETNRVDQNSIQRQGNQKLQTNLNSLPFESIDKPNRGDSGSSHNAIRAPNLDAAKIYGFDWLRNCREAGFSSDPLSCGHFYKCTSMYAYRFGCPSGLLWSQTESSCVWPKDATC